MNPVSSVQKSSCLFPTCQKPPEVYQRQIKCFFEKSDQREETLQKIHAFYLSLPLDYTDDLLPLVTTSIEGWKVEELFHLEWIFPMISNQLGRFNSMYRKSLILCLERLLKRTPFKVLQVIAKDLFSICDYEVFDKKALSGCNVLGFLNPKDQTEEKIRDLYFKLMKLETTQFWAGLYFKLRKYSYTEICYLLDLFRGMHARSFYNVMLIYARLPEENQDQLHLELVLQVLNQLTSAQKDELLDSRQLPKNVFLDVIKYFNSNIPSGLMLYHLMRDNLELSQKILIALKRKMDKGGELAYAEWIIRHEKTLNISETHELIQLAKHTIDEVKNLYKRLKPDGLSL